MRWKRVRAAAVLRVEASVEAASEGVRRSFFRSSILRKSEMFSSSSWTEPELPPPTSANRPEPGCAEDVALPLPLLVWSSSVLFVPPEDNRARLWLKLLLYLVMGAGFGELEVDEVTAFSGSLVPCLRAGLGGFTGGGMPLASFREARTGALGKEVRGEPANGEIIAGDADKDGVLNGWNDMEGRRAGPAAPSAARGVGREL
jgi:hypothetical protein